jgi:murein DD-endopeptidase MepM/ murein hydrolase activator NlpD
MTLRPGAPSGSRRRIRAGRIAAAAVPILVIAAVLIWERNRGPSPAPPRPDAAAVPPSPVPPPPAPVRVRERVGRGATLASIMKGRGATDAEIHALKEAVKPVHDLARIRAGHEFRFVLDPDGAWRSFEYDIDSDTYLAVEREGPAFRAAVKALPIETRAAVVWGRIEDNLIGAVNAAGEEDWLALRLAELFGWDIDFHTDLQPGDTFRVVFEKKYLDGKFRGYVDILAAEFVNSGRRYTSFRYMYPDTKAVDYFDADGNSLRREFLRSPLKFGRVTSRFSRSRFHPIRKTYRPHHGVDYGAPVGTAIQATADGTVTQAGWNGNAGRMIKLRHANGYETMYLHLSRIKVRVGSRVRTGEVIGEVGSSGESTGPHLDYRIIYRGSYVNPLGWRFKPADPLRKEFREPFLAEAARLSVLLEAPAWFAQAAAGIILD